MQYQLRVNIVWIFLQLLNQSNTICTHCNSISIIVLSIDMSFVVNVHLCASLLVIFMHFYCNTFPLYWNLITYRRCMLFVVGTNVWITRWSVWQCQYNYISTLCVQWGCLCMVYIHVFYLLLYFNILSNSLVFIFPKRPLNDVIHGNNKHLHIQIYQLFIVYQCTYMCSKIKRDTWDYLKS